MGDRVCLATTSHPVYDGRKKREDTTYVKARSAANLRERRRMQCLNEAFEGLRSHIPTLPYEKRLSKVDTLRLAICYINFLTELIESDDESSGELSLSQNKKQGKVLIYTYDKDYSESNGLPLLRGHSLSWSNVHKKKPSNRVKTIKIWQPEVPRKTTNAEHF